MGHESSTVVVKVNCVVSSWICAVRQQRRFPVSASCIHFIVITNHTDHTVCLVNNECENRNRKDDVNDRINLLQTIAVLFLYSIANCDYSDSDTSLLSTSLIVIIEFELRFVVDCQSPEKVGNKMIKKLGPTLYSKNVLKRPQFCFQS